MKYHKTKYIVSYPILGMFEGTEKKVRWCVEKLPSKQRRRPTRRDRFKLWESLKQLRTFNPYQP